MSYLHVLAESMAYATSLAELDSEDRATFLAAAISTHSDILEPFADHTRELADRVVADIHAIAAYHAAPTSDALRDMRQAHDRLSVFVVETLIGDVTAECDDILSGNTPPAVDHDAAAETRLRARDFA